MEEAFLEQVRRWALETPSVEGALVVGSYARGPNRPDSDLDLGILTTERDQLVEDRAFPARFGVIQGRQVEQYGACTSVRVWYRGGLEVEFGLVNLSWMARPLDAGTKQVLQGGYRVLVDKGRCFTPEPPAAENVTV